MTKIIPAILTDSPLKFKELVRRIEPYAQRIHIDIADETLVPNKTIKGFEEIKEIESALKFGAHLMMLEPERVIKDWLFTHVNRIILHIESSGDLSSIISNIRQHGREVGLAINPETSVKKLEQFIGKIDFVQFMTVHPGFQGGEFVDDVVDRMSDFHKKYPDVMIICDGGVTPETAPRLAKAGASELVSGSYIIKSQNIEKAIQELNKSVEN